jgi:putative two-component system response regulator
MSFAILETTWREELDVRPFSTAHSRRVGRIAARLAARLGLSPRYIEMLREAAPLHDIGKLAIPREICAKQGPLTLRERAIMQTHTERGARILARSDDPMLQMAATIARSHHERWDGEGYPDAIAGWEIPLCARIVAVADVFDALTHERPYKGAWSVERALSEIRDSAGGQFDPDIVAAFLDAHGQGSRAGRRELGARSSRA